MLSLSCVWTPTEGECSKQILLILIMSLLYIRCVSILYLRERGHWGDPDVDGRIILGWMFRKLEGVVGTGWSWLRIGTGGGHL
jgi:hypothetical protein